MAERRRHQQLAVDAVFELMETRPQSEGAFELAETSLGFEDGIEIQLMSGFEGDELGASSKTSVVS